MSIEKLIRKVQHPSKIIDDGYVQIIDDEITDENAEIIEEQPEITRFAISEFSEQFGEDIDKQIEKQQKNAEEVRKKKEYGVNTRQVLMTIHQKIHNKLYHIINYLENLDHNNYVLVYEHQKEMDKNGQQKPPHYHLFAQFSQPTKISAKRCFNANLKAVWMSAQANINYLKGLDKNERHKHITTKFIYESGYVRHRRGAINGHEVIRIYEEQGNVLSLDSRFYNVNMRIVKDYNQEQGAKQFVENKLKQKENPIIVNYHVGESGAHKTTEVCEEYHNHEKYDYAVLEFDDNGFSHFLGSEKAEYLLINEFRDSNITFKNFLEILQNEHQFNIKGSSMYMPNLKQIDITTVQPLHQIYKKCCEDRYQIQRRITNTYYYTRGKPRVKVETNAGVQSFDYNIIM